MVGGGYGCGQRMLTIQISSEYMHGIAGGVLVVVVMVILGGGRRPRSKLKTGWTGNAAAWTAPAGQMAQALCGANTGLPACLPRLLLFWWVPSSRFRVSGR